jgi:RNA:NAD 2'-phosphotransferase (TPT1/KptA family)
VDVDELLENAENHGMSITHIELERNAIENDKQRFAFNDDHGRIRAAQDTRSKSS